MLRRPFCAAFALLATVSSATVQAQVSIRTDAQVRVTDPRGNPLPRDFVIVRDSRGQVLTPAYLPGGSFALADVGPKVVFELLRKGLKQPVLELVLEQAPLVYVTLVVDPGSGRIKSVTQKPQRPQPSMREKVRSMPGGQPLPPLAPPANDDCANALPILDGSTAFSTLGATTDGPAHPGDCMFDGQTYEDIWFEYIASCTGALTVSTCGTAAYDTDLVIYDGVDCSLLSRLGCNDDGFLCPNFSSQLTVPVVAGNPYLIRVGGFGPGDEGTGTLNVGCEGAPSNDECAGALLVACGDTATVSNAAATSSASDPAFSCAFGSPIQGAGTLWFAFVATETTATVDTELSTLVGDTLLAAYDGSCGALVELACGDDVLFSRLSRICMSGLTPGNTYLVQTASYPGTAQGDITLRVTCPGPCGPPAGDECAEAPLIECNSSTFYDIAEASVDPLDPLFSCAFFEPRQGFGTVWHRFVAATPSVQIDTEGSNCPDTLLAVYDGSCGALVELACDDDGGTGSLSKLCLDGLTIGHTYYVETAAYGVDLLTEFTLNLTCPCPPSPANDECAGAIDVGPLPASVAFDDSAATDDIVFPCDLFQGPYFNVWYRVTGTGNVLEATTCNDGTTLPFGDTKISVFCQDCAARVCVKGNDDSPTCLDRPFLSTVRWCSQAGATYLITVGAAFPFDLPGVIQLDVSDTGESCSADVLCLPQGACCLGGSTCVTTTQANCTTLGGSYQGDGTACTTNAVADGGFEAGAFGGIWTESSTNFGSPICNVAFCGFGGSAGPHLGDSWALFGGAFTFEESALAQSVTIPANASTLDFFLEIPVTSGNIFDFLEVRIDGVRVFLAHENDGPRLGYSRVSIPIAAFADGGAHLLRFHSVVLGEGQNGPALTNFFVDDVSIESASFDCPQCMVLDFETQDDLVTPLANGQTISTPPEFGLHVSISSSGANRGAAIFDSRPGGPNHGGADEDLLVDHGNLLILQDRRLGSQSTPGFFDVPIDDPDGGDLIFQFGSPVEPQSVLLIDLDPPPNHGASVTLFDSAGRTRVYAVPPGWTGAFGVPGLRTLDLTTLAPQPGNPPGFRIATVTQSPGFVSSEVVKIVVHLTGLGAIDELSFCK